MVSGTRALPKLVVVKLDGRTDRSMDQRTDNAGYRVACTRLKKWKKKKKRKASRLKTRKLKRKHGERKNIEFAGDEEAVVERRESGLVVMERTEMREMRVMEERVRTEGRR